MRRRSISILLILLASCKSKTPGWQTLDFGEFKMKTPQSWTIFKEQGIDSYVGGLTNGKDSLWFDYGLYSPDIGDENPKKHKFSHDTINGLLTRLVIPTHQGDGYTRMYIRVNTEDRFSISGHNMESTDTILKMFKSIVFKESDTLINGSLTIDKFKEYPKGTGKILFQQYCMSCHSLIGTSRGPQLREIMLQTDSDWLYKFITNRKLVADDTHLKLKKAYDNVECAEFPSLTEEDIELIAFYIMTK